MNIISGTTEFRIPEKTVVSIGKFDGVHKGHLTIIDRMKKYIRRGYKTCILTFDIPPSSLGFGPDNGVLMTNREKRFIFSTLGIDYYVEFPFYEKTASIPAQQFIEEFISDRLNAAAVVVGEDCTFGQGAAGNAQMLLDFGRIYDYEVEIIKKIRDGKREISSTYMKELLQEGKVSKVMDLSYYPYSVRGRFRRNPIKVSSSIFYYVMDMPEEKIMPLDGVYYSKAVCMDELFDAITNVRNDERVFETYLYGGVQGIQREDLTISLLEWKREELKYYKVADLNRKIKEDIFDGQKWHKENSVVEK